MKNDPRKPPDRDAHLGDVRKALAAQDAAPGQEDPGEAAALAFTGLVQAGEAGDHRTATRLTRHLRQLGWSVVRLNSKSEGGRG